MYSFIDSSWFLPVAVVLYLVAIEAGRRLALSRPQEESRAIAGSIIMFLALMLAFTIGEAAQLYRTTLKLQGDEVDAIAETWRRFELLQPPERTRLIGDLRLYMDEKMRPGIPQEAKVWDLQMNLWDQMGGIVDRYGESSNTGQLLTAVNKMIALHWRLQYNTRQRVPLAIVLLNFAGILLVSLLVGFSTGSKQTKGWVVKLIYLGMVMLTVNAIRTLGQLRTGAESANRENLKGLYEVMRGGKGTPESP